MRETLTTELDLMFGHEGGYDNNPKDPGGATKYGITHRTLAAHRGVPSVTPAQVKVLGKEEATEIYRKSYWIKSGGDLLPVGIDYMAFDYGVNSGPAQAIKSLQRVVGVAVDGIVGGQTVAAVKAHKGDQTVFSCAVWAKISLEPQSAVYLDGNDTKAGAGVAGHNAYGKKRGAGDG